MLSIELAMENFSLPEEPGSSSQGGSYQPDSGKLQVGSGR